MGRLDGKVALVTGGARGTGAAIAKAFAAEGARVVVTDVLDDRGEETAAEIGAEYRHLDVTSEANWQAAVDCAESLDVLVNSAGVLHLWRRTVGSGDELGSVCAANRRVLRE